MHEIWLCKSILNIITEKTKNKPVKRVKKIILEIGELASVEQSAMMLGFEVISHGTIADGAKIEVIHIPAKGQCDACGAIMKVAQYYHQCSFCENSFVTVVEGQELRVKSMEVE